MTSVEQYSAFTLQLSYLESLHSIRFPCFTLNHSSAMSLRACSCLCQCSTKPLQATTSYTTIRAASSSTSYPVRPPRGWTLPNFQRAKKSVDLPSPRVQKFENKVSFVAPPCFAIRLTSYAGRASQWRRLDNVYHLPSTEHHDKQRHVKSSFMGFRTSGRQRTSVYLADCR